MVELFRHLRKILRLCTAGPAGKASLFLYGFVLALELGSVAVALRVIDWTKNFYDALQQMDAGEALRQALIFGVIVAVEAVRNLCSIYFRKMLEIRWREALTSRLLDRWLTTGRGTSRAGALDNPDQRIADDSRIFLIGNVAEGMTVSGFIPLSLDIVTRTVGLVSYAGVLWSLSSFALDLSVIGVDWSLPRYMVWLAFLYVFLAIGITHLLGRPLRVLYYKQQQREADYRFGLINARKHAEEIALTRGQDAERGELDRRFTAIVTNWRLIIGRELRLSAFTYPYYYTALRIPTFLALPAYFAGALTFGGLMQISSAFGKVVTTMSWFIFSYRPLSELAAAAKRLGGLIEFLENDAGLDDHGKQLTVAVSSDGKLHLQGVRLSTPDGQALLTIPDLVLDAGEALWVRGPSGSGKTTFGKAVAGCWRHGQGRIATPSPGFMVLPQSAYLPLGDAVDAVCYPRPAGDFSEAAIDAALADAGLDPRQIRRLRHDDLAQLSGGEVRRLLLARLFLHRPLWALLDEATAGLDPAAEKSLLLKLRRRLPRSGFIIVSHRAPEGLGPMRPLDTSAATASKALVGAD